MHQNMLGQRFHYYHPREGIWGYSGWATGSHKPGTLKLKIDQIMLFLSSTTNYTTNFRQLFTKLVFGVYIVFVSVCQPLFLIVPNVKRENMWGTCEKKSKASLSFLKFFFFFCQSIENLNFSERGPLLGNHPRWSTKNIEALGINGSWDKVSVSAVYQFSVLHSCFSSYFNSASESCY